MGCTQGRSLPVLNEPVCFYQHHCRLDACLSSPQGKKGLYRGRRGTEPFLRQCRPSTDFLWCWRMPVTADLPWDLRKSQGEREMVNQWCTNPAQLLSFLTQWPLLRFRRGSYLCFWWNVSSGKRLIALDDQLTIAGCILLCWIFNLTTQLEKRNTEN